MQTTHHLRPGPCTAQTGRYSKLDIAPMAIYITLQDWEDDEDDWEPDEESCDWDIDDEE